MEDTFSGGEEKYKYFTGMKTGDLKRYDGFSFGTKIFQFLWKTIFLHLKKKHFFNEDTSTLIYARYIEWLTAN